MYGRMFGRMNEGGKTMRCKSCGSRSMRKNYTRQRVKGLMESWLCLSCGKSRTVPVPKPKKVKGVSINPKEFTDD